MTPTSYTELFIFLVGAVGAALAVGTGAALLRYRRTGRFPGEHAGGEARGDGGATGPAAPDDAVARAAVAKLVLGMLVVAGSVAALATVRA